MALRIYLSIISSFMYVYVWIRSQATTLINVYLTSAEKLCVCACVCVCTCARVYVCVYLRACVRVCVIVARPTCLLLSKRNCAQLEQDRGGSLQGRKHFHLDYRNHLQPYFFNIYSTNMTATIISSFLDYGDVSYKVGWTLWRENRAPEYDVFAANNISLATLHFWVRFSTFCK